MGVKTSNAYGSISITDEAIAQVAGSAALGCYGIVDLVSKKFSDSLADMFRRHRSSKGVRVTTYGDRIYIELFVFVKYGVSIEAVAQSLKNTVKYSVQNFTNMVVDTINVNVIGVKI
ncbi:MAG: Asp23/Gls24 family envelope stress response protein [Firmicutes bacterium]|nr:Asp23/Gls24 family envelope stress response protein [Bacillota bacterium]